MAQIGRARSISSLASRAESRDAAPFPMLDDAVVGGVSDRIRFVVSALSSSDDVTTSLAPRTGVVTRRSSSYLEAERSFFVSGGQP
jgi:hypothetical protein